MRKLLVFLVVIAALGVGGDRLAAGLVADEAERRLEAEGFTAPSVTMHGFPFLNQLAARRFERVTLTADALNAGDGEARAVSAELTDVHAPASGPVQVAALTASGTVPYDVVSRAVGAASLQIAAAPGGQVQVSRTVKVAGQSFDVVAKARVRANGTRLRIVPTGLEVAGVASLDARLTRLLSDQVAFVYEIPDLPAGVRVEQVRATPSGFQVRVSGRTLSMIVSGIAPKKRPIPLTIMGGRGFGWNPRRAVTVVADMEGLVVVAVVLVAATALGLRHARSGRRIGRETRRPAGPGSADDRPLLTAAELGEPLGERATLLQFSTAFCQPCRATRRILAGVAQDVDGVAHVEIDAESRLDLVRRLNVKRTPTVLVLDAAGRVVRRASGQPRTVDVVAALGRAISA